VVIVEVDDARLVLGVTASNINVLHKLPPAPHGGRACETPDFQSVMKSLLKRSGRS
jgi:flagellar protein FliO/FliZ